MKPTKGGFNLIMQLYWTSMILTTTKCSSLLCLHALIHLCPEMHIKSVVFACSIIMINVTKRPAKSKCKPPHCNSRVSICVRFIFQVRIRVTVYVCIHTYKHNLYLNTIIFKATKACGVMYLRIKVTYSTAKHIYKSNIFYVFKNIMCI